ncbi:hypothetical protein EYF80_025996 [Liparis tanakae]|uniref:Uncharacterized protein n=1 Tax=Liparis tanakae TaxID=230148 RepID=A0A4Z2HFU8_9TELE|nr:hypothetical protein EYF80_025996 [Liparis tanakae]
MRLHVSLRSPDREAPVNKGSRKMCHMMIYLLTSGKSHVWKLIGRLAEEKVFKDPQILYLKP